MTIGVNNNSLTSNVRVVARDAAPAAPAKAPEAPKAADGGAVSELGKWLEATGISSTFEKALNAKSSDEVVAGITGGLAQLAIERTGVKDFDKQLHTDLRGTITKYVSNETAQKALLAMADILGDKVASEMISAGVGAIAGTTVELVKDEKFRTMRTEDPTAFGLELAKRAGKNFAVALGGAFAVAKAEELLPAGFKWLAKIPFIRSLLGIKDA
jgi:hypothetical protein